MLALVQRLKNDDSDWTARPTGWVPLGERSKVYGFSQSFQDWYISLHDEDGDGVKTLRDLLVSGQQNGYTFDIDLIVEAKGETFDWLLDTTFIATVTAFKYADLTADQWSTLANLEYEKALTGWFQELIMQGQSPIMFDLLLPDASKNMMATLSELADVVYKWQHEADDWDASSITNWVSFSERILPFYPYVPTEEMVRETARTEINDVIAILEKMQNILNGGEGSVNEVSTKSDQLENVAQLLEGLQVPQA